MKTASDLDLSAASRAALTDPSDADALLLAVRALFSAIEGGKDVSGLDDLLRVLLTQEDCAVRPLIFAHEAASHATSNNRAVLPRLAQVVAPVLSALVEAGDREVGGYKNVVVFAITMRAFLQEAVPKRELTRLHLHWFEKFEPEDLALPYSVMFNEDIFGQNRNEILAYNLPDAVDNPLFRPWHLLFLEWLSGQDLFTASDNADLARFLERSQPWDIHDIAAVRMLVMRHWHPDGVLELETVGLKDIAPLAREVAGTRAALPEGQPRRPGARLMQNRAYQAVQAGWGLSTAAAPFLNTGQRQVRVALCLSGQMRGYETAFESWKRTVLPQAKVTVFIHSWEKIGRSDAQPFRYVLPFEGRAFADAYRQIALGMGYDEMRARYPALFAGLADGARVEADRLRALYGTDHVVLEDDEAERFAGFSNQEKMHYKIQAADRLARAAGEFDLHMRLRPDLAVRARAFDWRDMADQAKARPVLYSEKPAGVHYGTLMIGDQCALAAPDTMSVYADTYETFPRAARAGLTGCPEVFTGHTSLALITWMRGISVQRVPIKFGGLQEASPMPLIDILAALETDSRGEEADRHLIDAVHADMKEAA